MDNNGASTEPVVETVTEQPIDTQEQILDPQGIDEFNLSEDPEEVVEPEPENDLFDPEKIDFESEGETTFGSYDLSKYKDQINFADPVVAQAFAEEATKLEKLGASQELMEYFLETLIDVDSQTKEVANLTNAEVKEGLNKHLTIEEKRNFKTITNFTTEALKGTEMEGDVKEILSNPFIVKLVNSIYKKATGGKIINKSNVPEQGQKIEYTIDNVQKQYEKFLESNPAKESEREFLSNMYTKIPDKDKKQFEFIYEGLFKK